MKGLLIKDLELIKSQKSFLIMMVVLSLAMLLFNESDPTFIVGFLPCIGAMLSINTLGFDQYESGFKYLFTLPIDRKQYVLEKYGLALLLIVVSTAFATGLVMITSLSQPIDTHELGMAALSVIPVAICIMAFMFPVQLRYGSESGRLVFLIVFLAIGVLSGTISQLFENIDLSFFAPLIQSYAENPTLFLISILALSLLVFGASMYFSIRVLKKKEL